jgi:hypothetical protein
LRWLTAGVALLTFACSSFIVGELWSSPGFAIAGSVGILGLFALYTAYTWWDAPRVLIFNALVVICVIVVAAISQLV